MQRYARVLILALGLIVASAQSASAGRFEVVENDDGMLLTESGRNVLFYQRRPKSQEGRYRRANYVHPLYGLDGEVLTEDFPEDHPHHRGIFWAWHQIWAGEAKRGDSWTTEDFESNVEAVRILKNDETSVDLETHVLWSSPSFKDQLGRAIPFVDEHVHIRTYRSTESQRAIDFEIILKALDSGIRIGGADDEKGYGGFSVRVCLPEGLEFTGTHGRVDPMYTAVDAGPWLNMSTEKQGLAILTHPSNPGHPPPWVLRRQRAMQNPSYPGRESVALSCRDPLVLRYRLVLHRGQLDRAALDRAQKEYGNVMAPSSPIPPIP